MKVKVLIACMTVLIALPLMAGSDLIAYPVPFDPIHQTLSLKYKTARAAGSVRVIIFDINGDRVLERSYSDITVFKWKGFTDSGRRVATGLYIIKVIWEDASGNMITDVVRVTLVKRTQ
jgi:hypothetical protein